MRACSTQQATKVKLLPARAKKKLCQETDGGSWWSSFVFLGRKLHFAWKQFPHSRKAKTTFLSVRFSLSHFFYTTFLYHFFDQFFLVSPHKKRQKGKKGRDRRKSSPKGNQFMVRNKHLVSKKTELSLPFCCLGIVQKKKKKKKK